MKVSERQMWVISLVLPLLSHRRMEALLSTYLPTYIAIPPQPASLPSPLPMSWRSLTLRRETACRCCLQAGWEGESEREGERGRSLLSPCSPGFLAPLAAPPSLLWTLRRRIGLINLGYLGLPMTSHWLYSSILERLPASLSLLAI